MNISILIDGADVTDRAVLSSTRISYDSTRRVSTATVAVNWAAPGEGSLYDEAVYDESPYTFEIRDLALITILDARDGVTKLFEGTVTALELKQTDMAFPNETQYVCTANDYSMWLDRAVILDNWPIIFPVSDQLLIQNLVGEFCPRIKAAANVTKLIPVLPSYEYGNKTCRQLLDDLCVLSGGAWHVDFYGELFYGSVTEAPAAPYDLSTDPDYETSFPVRVDTWRRDFSSPINTCYVRGALDQSGVYAQATYIDPISVKQFGPLDFSIVDTQITDSSMAMLRAQTMVLQYAQPQEQGAFTIWTDGLALGQKVNIFEQALGIDDAFVIRALTMAWIDSAQVVYSASFGAMQPDLESYLRLLDQRTRWQSAAVLNAKPIDGSVGDSSISAGGISGGIIAPGSIQADQIGSIDAHTITVNTIVAGQISSIAAGAITVGKIQSNQIGSIDAQTITVGQIAHGQIGSIAADTITVGQITHTQIGSIDAASITVGVIISDQVADGLIDELSKFATSLVPIQVLDAAPTLPNGNNPPNSYFYVTPNGHFYQVNAAGTGFTDAGSDPALLTGAMKFYSIGKISVKSFVGLILAAQIDTIDAHQISGQIQANQIGSINAGSISGSITADQIDKVYASDIQGGITANQITSIDANTITVNQIVSTQIKSINATTINIGQIVDGQIADIAGSKLHVGTVNSDKLNANSIDCGGGGGKPGVINTYDGAGTVVARMGLLTTSDYGIWAKVFGAGGTSYADAVLKTDTSGNLTITNAYLDIEHSATNTYIQTGPATFDSTYGSIALVTAGHASGDMCKLVTRGVVCYYQGTIVAAIVRSPTTPSAGAVQLKNGILLDGADGSIHGNVFVSSVDSRSGISGNYTTATGTQFIFSGGIVTYYSQPAITGITTQVNIPVPNKSAFPTQYWECYFTNGILVSSTLKPIP